MNTRNIRLRSRFKAAAFMLLPVLVNSCSVKNSDAAKNTLSNKAFVYEMISTKKKLDDYPGRISDSMVVYEPSSLPFGGVYKGYKAFTQFYPKVREFYDFSKFELLNVYADSNIVFALIKAGIASTGDSILLCEYFTFDTDGRITEIRIFLHDFEGKPIHSLVKGNE